MGCAGTCPLISGLRLSTVGVSNKHSIIMLLVSHVCAVQMAAAARPTVGWWLVLPAQVPPGTWTLNSRQPGTRSSAVSTHVQ